jgi:transposase-like protein
MKCLQTHSFNVCSYSKTSHKVINFKFTNQCMSKDEIKYEINRVLDKFSSNALEELLSFLKQLEERKNSATLNSDLLQRILSEDKELLEKLAQ